MHPLPLDDIDTRRIPSNGPGKKKSGRPLSADECNTACAALSAGANPSKLASEMRVPKKSLLAMWAERELARRSA